MNQKSESTQRQYPQKREDCCEKCGLPCQSLPPDYRLIGIQPVLSLCCKAPVIWEVPSQMRKEPA